MYNNVYVYYGMEYKECWEGRYLISNDGTLKNKKTGKIRKKIIHSQGYIQYTLYSKELNKQITVLAHRLVAEAFISNPNNYKFINHKNGIKTDNRVENLEWCTRKMNEEHAFRTGLKNSTGSFNTMSKLNEEKVLDIKKNCDPSNVYDYAEKYGVHRATIQRIINNKIWTHVKIN